MKTKNEIKGTKVIDGVEAVCLGGSLTITKESDGGFPLNIGGLIITSKDGKRNFVLDTESTNYTNEEEVGFELTFSSELSIDFDTFEKGEDYNYNLLVEDLNDAKAVLYLSRCDLGENDGDFDYDNPNIGLSLYVTSNNTKGKWIDIDLELDE
jgi:hypothetical protein